MNLQIKNTDEFEEVLISGIQKDGPSYSGEVEARKTRFVLRPGETREFNINSNEILGMEIL